MNRFAKGRRYVRGQMNKTEAAYAEHLERQKQLGRVLWYGFEAFKLRLAKNTTFSPDFVVLMDDMTIELHEVKGYWLDDARAKTKVAAETFPFLRFIAVQMQSKKNGGGWKMEEFAP